MFRADGPAHEELNRLDVELLADFFADGVQCAAAQAHAGFMLDPAVLPWQGVGAWLRAHAHGGAICSTAAVVAADVFTQRRVPQALLFGIELLGACAAALPAQRVQKKFEMLDARRLARAISASRAATGRRGYLSQSLISERASSAAALMVAITSRARARDVAEIRENPAFPRHHNSRGTSSMRADNRCQSTPATNHWNCAALTVNRAAGTWPHELLRYSRRVHNQQPRSIRA